MQLPKEPRIAVIGLGYVGTPLAVALADVYPTVGFDIDVDRTGEIEPEVLADSKVTFTSEASTLRESNTYIITVPTPIDDNNVPRVNDYGYLGQ